MGDYDKYEIPARDRNFDPADNRGYRSRRRGKETLTRLNDECFLKILKKHPEMKVWMDPRDPLQRVLLIALEKMLTDVPGDIPYDLILIDSWRQEHMSKKLEKYWPLVNLPLMEDNPMFWTYGSWTILANITQVYQHRHNRKRMYPTELRKRAHCERMVFQSYELLRIVMEEYPNINGVILRKEKPDESRWEAIREMISLYDHHLNRKPPIEKWYNYHGEGKPLEWMKTADVEEFDFISEQHYNMGDIFGATPLYTILATGLKTEDELFKGYERVRKWYHRVLAIETWRHTNKYANEELMSAFHKALRGELDELPHLNLDKYKEQGFQVKSLTRFEAGNEKTEFYKNYLKIGEGK